MTNDNGKKTAETVERPNRTAGGKFGPGNDIAKKARGRPKGSLGWLKLLREKTTTEEFEAVVDRLLATAQGKTDQDELGAQKLLFKYLVPLSLLDRQTRLEHRYEAGEISALSDPLLVRWLREMTDGGS